MSKEQMIEEIKKTMGYQKDHKTCGDCHHFHPDDSTDNFGPGDLCTRNPDAEFKVDPMRSWCKKIFLRD